MTPGVGGRVGVPHKWSPRRTLWPTRDGWWCLAAAIALGVAAMNTGNNLLYLLASMLLGLIVVSGVLSEPSMRRLWFTAVVPEEIFAGTPALVGVRVGNGKRWRASYSLTVDVVGVAPVVSAYLPRLDAGAEQLVAWEQPFSRRGRHRFPRLRVGTRFPFGLFAKSGAVQMETALVIYPAVHAIAADIRRELAAGEASNRRRGRGNDLYNLRDYRAGDEPRLVHWRSTAKTGTLVVRELEADAAVDARIVLDGRPREGERLERALSEAASLAVHLLRAGGAVELTGPGIHVPVGRGREQRRRVLEALAVFDAGVAGRTPGLRRSARALRELRVSLG